VFTAGAGFAVKFCAFGDIYGPAQTIFVEHPEVAASRSQPQIASLIVGYSRAAKIFCAAPRFMLHDALFVTAKSVSIQATGAERDACSFIVQFAFIAFV
jgi:hypothetical protein